jgi:GNAT superfamily N-acetyltransferase
VVTDAELTQLCLTNAGLIGACAAAYGGTVERTDALDRHRVPVPGGLWNSVTRSAVAADDADRTIAETLAWYGGSCRWWTGPATEPADMDDRLLAAGFEGERIPAMVCDLTGDRDAADPRGLAIERATDRPAIDDAMVVFESIGGGGDWVGAWADVFAWFLDRPDEPVQVFVGRVDGAPVACGWLARGDGVTGVYGVQTIETHRGQGYGAALTRATMRAGRDAGDTMAVLQAAPLAEPLYARVGFRTVGTVGLFER